MHFAFTVTEETFDEVVKKFSGVGVPDAGADRASGTVQRASPVHLRPRRQRNRGQHALPVSGPAAIEPAAGRRLGMLDVTVQRPGLSDIRIGDDFAPVLLDRLVQETLQNRRSAGRFPSGSDRTRAEMDFAPGGDPT